MSAQQLFIGRLPTGTRSRDLEDIFYKYGKMTRCDVKQGLKMAYGFIEYEDNRDAEDAIKGEHGRDFMGARIVVEWARGPKYDYKKDRYRDDDKPEPRRDYGDDDRDRRREYRGGGDRDFTAKERRRSASRSRSPEERYRRRSRSRDRSPDHRRKRSHS